MVHSGSVKRNNDNESNQPNKKPKTIDFVKTNGV